MENTNTNRPLEERLQEALENKRSKEIEVRRQQVETLQGVLKIATTNCPNCGARLIKGDVPMDRDGEDDTRI